MDRRLVLPDRPPPSMADMIDRLARLLLDIVAELVELVAREFAVARLSAELRVPARQALPGRAVCRRHADYGQCKGAMTLRCHSYVRACYNRA